MNENNHRILAGEWFEKAGEDFEVAMHFFKERTFPAPICFHAHQAVGKYLKEVLVLHGKDIKDEFKTHNLIKLYEYANRLDSRIGKDVREGCFKLNH